MSKIRKIAAAGFLAAAASISPIALTQPVAQADSVPTCGGGGTVNVDTSPIGMAPSPVNGTVDGMVGNCQFHATFEGTDASCQDVNVNVNGTLTGPDGKESAFAGPFHVPGGVAGAPETNRLPITSGPGKGQQLVVDQGPISSAGANAGPCLTDSARSLQLPINSVTVA